MTCSFVVLTTVAQVSADVWEWINPDVRKLKSELVVIKKDLEDMGPRTIENTAQELGVQFHMAPAPPEESPWLQIDLGAQRSFDCIVLAPVIKQVETAGSPTYAFPRSLRIDVSDDEAFDKATTFASFDDTEFEARHGFPLIARGTASARFVRVTVTKLAEVAGRWTFAFSEMMVMDENRNVAIGAAVSMKLAPKLRPKWDRDYLVDGRTPFGPPIVRDLRRFDGVYCWPLESGEAGWMMVDLGERADVDEIRLVPIHARQGAALPGYGFPARLRVELFEDISMKQGAVVFDSGHEPFSNPGNNPVTFVARGIPTRCVKVTCLEPSHFVDRRRFGLSELQVYSGNINVALGKKASIPGLREDRSPDLLTDGFASYGRLLELRDWIEGWERYSSASKRIENCVEEIRAAQIVAQRRALRYAGTGVAGFLLCAAVVTTRRRRAREREKSLFRQGLAQDLHDQVGSNLAAIARLAELSELEKTTSGGRADWATVRALALECTDSMRQTLWLLGGPEHETVGFVNRLRATSERMLSGIILDWRESDELPDIDTDRELVRELFLAFKEAIANVAKHSQATEVVVELALVNGRLQLSIVDNGVGFCTDVVPGMGLTNIRRRTQKFGGNVLIESRSGVGTRVQLNIPIQG